jgi:hypothetical protein
VEKDSTTLAFPTAAEEKNVRGEDVITFPVTFNEDRRLTAPIVENPEEKKVLCQTVMLE